MGGVKGSIASPQTLDGTYITPLELPYEWAMYERPVYPGTLTYYGTVPNIELVTQLDGDPQRVAGDTVLANSSCANLFLTILFHGAESRRCGKCL